MVRKKFGSLVSCNSTYRLRYWNFNTSDIPVSILLSLQQYLPFTVLKLERWCHVSHLLPCCNSTYRLRYWNSCLTKFLAQIFYVATVLTVYGIETLTDFLPDSSNCLRTLQQYLPFTVLKHSTAALQNISGVRTRCNSTYRLRYWNWVGTCRRTIFIKKSCNSTYRLRYWNRNAYRRGRI